MGYSKDQSRLAKAAAEEANKAAILTKNAIKEAELWAHEAENATLDARDAAENAQDKADYIESKRTAIEQAFIDALEAKNKSVSAENIANLAKTIAETVQSQFNKIIAEAGSNNPEVVQARGGKVNLNARLDEFTNALADTSRQSTTLGTGTAVVNASVDTLADVEIEGRTLTSLPNSNLEATKKYVLADKKTKVVVDGITQSGVAKFVKGTSTVATANFVGKVSGSTVANPHIAKARTAVTLGIPATDIFAEFNELSNSRINSLNGAVNAISTSGLNIASQQLFSFDIIAEIERKLGIIPRTTVAEKVAWVKENVERLEGIWHGFGSSVGGNKANFTVWTGATWFTNPQITTNGTVSRLTFGTSSTNNVTSDGFVHYLAYAEPSDGVTPSTINTDYVELVVTLKATAQLNTRPTIIRVENFEGKISGSNVENPHVAKFGNGNALSTPADTWSENTQAFYSSISSVNADNARGSTTNNGGIAKHLFSFNIIEAVERNIGRIPRTSVADKVAWLKVNVARLQANWHGFGSSVGGNKSSFTSWSTNTNDWVTPVSHLSNLVTRLTRPDTPSTIAHRIDTNGFVHYLTYAEPSDSITPSVINTDYIDLEIELKPTADFTNPKVPLYEVDDATYNKILVDWNADEVVNRFPIVEGTQHLQGVGVIAEGENLLPPFTEWLATGSATILKPYESEIIATSSGWVNLDIEIPTLPGNVYYLSNAEDGGVRVYDGNTSSVISSLINRSFVATSNKVKIRFTNGGALGTFKFKNPMLTLGSVAKPFVPRNPSYLFADVKLGAIGTARDMLYKQDGRWVLRKAVEKDVVLDGSLAWGLNSDFIGHKELFIPITNAVIGTSLSTKYDGKILKYGSLEGDYFNNSGGSVFRFRVSDLDTGFGEIFAPTTSDIKRYFNGWKYVDGTTWTSITGNGQTATGQVALDTKPTDYTPYKLSYQLATPTITDLTDKVEGVLKLGGATQVSVDSGYVRREKVVPFKSDKYWFNEVGKSQFKNRLDTLIAIYKNGQRINSFTSYSSLAYGKGRYGIEIVDFDPTAEYTVTYLALDKPKLTTNPTNVKLTYANSVRNALDDTVTNVQDNSTQLSVHEKAIVELYVRVKALEVK